VRYEEFIDRVAEHVTIGSREQAIIATQATLETLGERLDRDERDDLASQLPHPLKEYLLARPDTDRFLLEEFYNRVSARAGVRRTHGVRQAQAVMSVLQEAIAQGEWQDMLDSLPDDYRVAFSVDREVV
jgi:uncharacterized protein (DUF2267 family)